MNTYFRITAYYPKEDFSVILDTHGKYEEIWQFSAYLVSKRFKIIEVCEASQIAETTFPLLKEKSGKIYLRAIGKGRPEVEEFTYMDRPCKSITVYDKIYGQF